ncbi:MAG: branched-chain amino acid ABC transporter ATP-binding protein/permease [Dehalococcoidia bacterium]|nr:branched-chain amino acid ABC transporter ATP-binding protein/permease [Dehalococcoidia bacterium]
MLPFFVKEIFYLYLGSIIFLFLAAAVGWNVIARSGQVSFAHAGFWAIGAYTSALLTTRLGMPFFLCFVLAGILSATIACLLGMVFVRAAGIFFALLTMGVSEVIRLFIINVPALTYGVNGVVGVPPPVLPIINVVIESKAAFYWLNFSFAALVVVFATVLYRSPWGSTLLAVRDNFLLAECTGINTRWYKILAFSIGSLIAGLTGSLLAPFLTFVGPESFTFWKSFDAVAMNVVGGIGSVAGPIIGAFIMCPLPELLRGFVAYQAALYGLIIVLIVVLLPNGLISLPAHLPILRKLTISDNKEVREEVMPLTDQSKVSESPDIRWRELSWQNTERSHGQNRGLLQVKNVSKNFGGVAAVSDVTLAIGQGEIFGIIGPNGSGKSTVFNLISGVIRPDSGTVMFKGEDITGLAAHKVARRGLTRTFQATTLYCQATVWENVVRGRSFSSGVSFWSSLFGTGRRNYREACRKTELLLDLLGLNVFRKQLPSNLPYGVQKQIQLAIALATEPEIILVDEPVSGMNPLEAAAMATIIKRVRDLGVTVVVVEHNMDFVMNLCERIAVLDHGVKIAEGSCEEIRNNPAVIEAYLGAEDAN